MRAGVIASHAGSQLIEIVETRDARRIVPLNSVVQDLHAAMRPDLFRSGASVPEVASYFASWLGRPGIHVLVATEDGRDLGYALFEKQARPGDCLTMPERRGILHHVAVIAAARRRGVGMALIGAMRDRLAAEGVTRWTTAYWSFNAASAALMAKAGAVPAYVVAEAAV